MEQLLGKLFVFSDIDFITTARVALAFLLGGIVGYERERVRQPAGLRTHMLVSAGAACFTVASVYGFADMGGSTDPARLAAQIVSGVGFLGAGTIFRSGSTVRGLTTASSIWVTAAIGIVAGLGMLWLALTTTFLTWVTLRLLKGLEVRRFKIIASAERGKKKKGASGKKAESNGSPPAESSTPQTQQDVQYNGQEQAE